MAAKEKKMFCDVCGRRLGAFSRYSSPKADLCADCYDLINEATRGRWKDKSVDELRHILEEEKVLEARNGYDVREEKRIGRRLSSLAVLAALVIALILLFYAPSISYRTAPEKLEVTAALERVTSKDIDLDVTNLRPGSYPDEAMDLRVYYGYYVDGEKHVYNERHKGTRISELASGVPLKIYRRSGAAWKVYKGVSSLGRIFFVFLAAIIIRAAFLIKKRTAVRRRIGPAA